MFAARINIDIGAITPISTGATQQHPLRMHSDIFVERNDFSFNTTAFSLTVLPITLAYQINQQPEQTNEGCAGGVS